MTYSPEKYQANKEAIKAAQKRYYLKTREERLAKQKAYDQAHKEQIATRHKEKRYGRKSKTKVLVEVGFRLKINRAL